MMITCDEYVFTIIFNRAIKPAILLRKILYLSKRNVTVIADNVTATCCTNSASYSTNSSNGRTPSLKSRNLFTFSSRNGQVPSKFSEYYSRGRLQRTDFTSRIHEVQVEVFY